MINKDKPTVGIPQTELNIGSGFNLLVGGVYKLIIGAAGLTGLVNLNKANTGEKWSSSTLSWNDESRTWEAVSQLFTNVYRDASTIITNVSKP